MHARTKITDLSVRQYAALDRILKADYEIPAGTTPVCVIFELSTMNERHVSMPVTELAQVLYVLELIERGAVAEATLTDAERPTGIRPHRLMSVGEVEQAQHLALKSPGYDSDFADRLENGAYR